MFLQRLQKCRIPLQQHGKHCRLLNIPEVQEVCRSSMEIPSRRRSSEPVQGSGEPIVDSDKQQTTMWVTAIKL
ncbi:hypothetical protein An18g02300 [Aspergillus niger]|uniref:Uncharacterized protein n=2 Tax=Aspergillus niger TaxID=5061 RepID=A2RA87_ASPNC|nr:hypothetical protein An18g02300 [Aspergillus niger]CAK47302.1 hypothetical protein An18g02300 [Aspergillus niger]